MLIEWGCIVIGFACFFVASYRAWKREHDAREKAEAELRQLKGGK